MPRSALLDARGAGGVADQRPHSTSLIDETPTPSADEEVATDLDPRNAALTNLLCAWSIGFLSAIEGTISVPSLWQYIDSLGGTHEQYGYCIAAFALFRVSAMGLFGMWVDARSYKEVWVVSLLVSMVAGFVYSSGPTFGVGVVVAGRSILGAMSAQSVAQQAFVSTNTSLADRTKYMSINSLVSNVLTAAGPVFNLVIVALPRFTVHIFGVDFVFNSYTWVGYFLFVGQVATLCFILRYFEEPERKERRKAPTLQPCGSTTVGNVVTLWGLFPWMRVWTDRWLRITGSWMIFFINFRNNYTMFAVTYAIPLITDRDYGYGQLENSYIYLALTVTSLASTSVIGWASKRWCDRDLLCCFQIISWSGLLTYTAVSGMGTKRLPVSWFVALLVWFTFGNSGPMTQGLYSKLIGRGNAGLYFAVLQSNGAISRVISGQLVGVAYGGLGPAAVWLSIHSLWCVQWATFCTLWSKITPEAIQAMHDRLEDEEAVNQKEAAGTVEAQRSGMKGSLEKPLLNASGGSE